MSLKRIYFWEKQRFSSSSNRYYGNVYGIYIAMEFLLNICRCFAYNIYVFFLYSMCYIQCVSIFHKILNFFFISWVYFWIGISIRLRGTNFLMEYTFSNYTGCQFEKNPLSISPIQYIIRKIEERSQFYFEVGTLNEYS